MLHEAKVIGKGSEVGRSSRSRAKSLSYISSAQPSRARLSRTPTLDESQIFTINENTPAKSALGRQQPDIKKPKLLKRQSTRLFTSRVPDITNFPLLVTSAEELLVASKRTRVRAMSAPIKTANKSEIDVRDERNKELLKDADNDCERSNNFKKLRSSCESPSMKLFSNVVNAYQFADSANTREQRQLERQIKGIQSLQRMNISSINKEKLCILQRSKALSSMLYPDVYTGKTPKFTPHQTRKDSCDPGTYLWDSSEDKNATTETVHESPAFMKWNNAVLLQRHRKRRPSVTLKKQ